MPTKNIAKPYSADNLIDQVESLLQESIPIQENIDLHTAPLMSVLSVRGKPKVRDNMAALFGKDLLGKLRQFNHDQINLINERTSSLQDEVAVRRATEDRLRESTDMVQVLADHADDDIFLISPTFNILFCNTYAAAKFQKQPADLIGQSLTVIFPSTTAPRMMKSLEQVFSTGDIVHRETEFAFQGEHTWLDTKLSPLKRLDGSVYAVMGISRDITLRKVAEEKSAEQLENYRRLFDASFEGVAVHDQGIILDANTTVADMFGYTREELIGTTITSYVTSESSSHIQSKIQTNDEAPYTVTGLKKNGQSFDIQLQGRSILYNGKQVRLAILHQNS